MSFISDLFIEAEQLRYEEMYKENPLHYIKVSRNMWELLTDYCKSMGVATGECDEQDGSMLGRLYGVMVVLDENIETWEIV